jgi:hypothetical protein
MRMINHTHNLCIYIIRYETINFSKSRLTKCDFCFKNQKSRKRNDIVGFRMQNDLVFFMLTYLSHENIYRTLRFK